MSQPMSDLRLNEIRWDDRNFPYELPPRPIVLPAEIAHLEHPDLKLIRVVIDRRELLAEVTKLRAANRDLLDEVHQLRNELASLGPQVVRTTGGAT